MSACRFPVPSDAIECHTFRPEEPWLSIGGVDSPDECGHSWTMRDNLLDPARFRALRKARGLTLAALAARAGVSLSYVKLLEAGGCQPSDPYARALAEALGSDITDISVPKDAAA